ncbi:ABC transporter permease [Candidatus Woesearchaeota archaeon]|nr:ABC transporter permease [Candidatus Woesearchaeota archaeon]
MKLHRVKAMLLNYYYFSLDSLDRLFDIFYWPIIDIFIWGFMTFYIQGLSEYNILNTVLGGIVLWIFLWRTSQDIVVYLLESFWSRSLYHLFSSPLKSSELLTSLLVTGFVRAFAAFGVMLSVSYLLYHFNVFIYNWFHFSILISILLIMGWGMGMLVSSFIFLFGTRVQVLAWSPVWVLQPFSCVFYPLSALPSWAAKIAIVLPTTHVFEQMRATVHGQPLNVPSVIYALVVSIIFLCIAAYIVSWAVESSRRNGKLAKAE